MVHKLPPGLYALIDDSVRPTLPLVDKARLALEGGAAVLQLRLELTADRPALEAVRAVVALAAGRAPVLVNDRVDLALVGGAAGVHLGARDVPVALARRLLGPSALIGVTARTLEDVRVAQQAGADHVGLGPVFATRTKQLEAPLLGLAGLAAICAVAPLPVVAIAGITQATIGAVGAAGAWCAAVASGLLASEDVAERARTLTRAFREGALLARGAPSGHSGGS